MKYLICFGLLISSLLCNGQTREKGNIELTPIVGYSASYQLDSFLLGSSAVSGIQLGIYGNYFFNNRLSLRTGLLYQKMGTNDVDFAILLPFVALFLFLILSSTKIMGRFRNSKLQNIFAVIIIAFCFFLGVKSLFLVFQ